MEEVIEQLRELNEPVPVPLELPDEETLVEVQEQILIHLPFALREYLLTVSDVVYGRLGPRAQAAVDMLAAALAIGFALFIVKVSIPYVDAAWSIDEGSPDPGGLPHRWLLKGLIPLGFALYALQSLAGLLQAAVRFKEAGDGR